MKTITQKNKNTKSETAVVCPDFIFKGKIENGKVVCPNCGNSHMNYYTKESGSWKCSRSIFQSRNNLLLNQSKFGI